MQRIFDILRASPDFLTVGQIAAKMKLDDGAVRKALERLNRLRVLVTICQDRMWRYGIKASAQRPLERGQREREKH